MEERQGTETANVEAPSRVGGITLRAGSSGVGGPLPDGVDPLGAETHRSPWYACGEVACPAPRLPSNTYHSPWPALQKIYMQIGGRAPGGWGTPEVLRESKEV